MAIAYKWPKMYPRGVPPDDSLEACGKVYRFVDKFPPDEDDFRMTREEQPSRSYTSQSDKIKSFGVSLFVSLSKAKQKQGMYTPLQSKQIATGDLIPELGKISKKPSRYKHITLWKCVGSRPHEHINQKPAKPTK